jgi:hypothetical protein
MKCLQNGENCITRSFVKEDEMGGLCNTYGREEERVYVIGWKAREKETIRKTKT